MSYKSVLFCAALLVLSVVSASRLAAQNLALYPLEQRVVGEFAIPAGPASRGDWIEFDGSHAFILHAAQLTPRNSIAGPCIDAEPRCTEIRRTGEYRFEGDAVHLTFWEGDEAVLPVIRWGEHGEVLGLAYNNQSFTRDWTPASTGIDTYSQASGQYFSEVEPVEVVPLPDPNESKHNSTAVLDALGAVFRVFTFFVSATAPAPQASQQAPQAAPATTEKAPPAKKDAPRNFGSTRGEKRKP